MTNAGFEKRDCWHCGGTGEAFDSTNQDKIFVGPNAGQCSTCRGRGFTEHNVSIVDTAPVREPAPVGDIPDWMC